MDWKRELFTAPWTAPGPNARLRWRFRASENRLVELWSFQNSYGILAFQGHRKRTQLRRHHPSKQRGLPVHKQSGGINCTVSRPFERRNLSGWEHVGLRTRKVMKLATARTQTPTPPYNITR